MYFSREIAVDKGIVVTGKLCVVNSEIFSQSILLIKNVPFLHLLYRCVSYICVNTKQRAVSKIMFEQ